MGAHATEALALRSFDFGESSQILHLFTRDLGRVHGIAKGARRLKGAFRGGVDLLTGGRAVVYDRRGASELRVLGAFDVDAPLPGLRRSLPRFHAAMQVAAVLLAFTLEDQPHPELFDLASATLRLLDGADDASAEAYGLGFEAMALRALGFGPELGRCVKCGRAARNVVTARLSALRGGLLCSACRGDDPHACEVDGAAVAALRALSEGPVVDAPHTAADPAVRRAVREALDRWTTVLLDRPIRR